MTATRNSIEDIWGPRTPFKGEGTWPTRVDENVHEQPESVDVLASALHGANTVIFQMAQGLRDRQMLDTALDAEEHIRRIQAWIENQVKHRAVHSLLVPM